MRKSMFAKITAIALALSLVFALGVSSFAADITSSGGNGTTPVHLSSTDDGTLDGEPAATALSVTVPTALPLAVDVNGNVASASNCKITNNSYGAVRVKSATITGANGWTITSFGDKSTLASEKVDSNKIGFALTVGTGSVNKTTGSENSQALISSPVAGCIMSGNGDTANNSAAVTYSAIVTPVSTAVTGANVANIVFVVEFDTVT